MDKEAFLLQFEKDGTLKQLLKEYIPLMCSCKRPECTGWMFVKNDVKSIRNHLSIEQFRRKNWMNLIREI